MPVNNRKPCIELHEQVRKAGGINLGSAALPATAQVVGHPYMFLLAVVVLGSYLAAQRPVLSFL